MTTVKTFIPHNLTRVGIVYGRTSGHVRRHIYPSQGDAGFAPHVATLLVGEAICFVPIAAHHAGHEVFHAAIRVAVQGHGGVPAVLFADDPGARMFARVNSWTNRVDNVTMADPDIPSDLEVLRRDNWIEFDPPAKVGIGHVYNPRTGKFRSPKLPGKRLQKIAA